MILFLLYAGIITTTFVQLTAIEFQGRLRDELGLPSSMK